MEAQCPWEQPPEAAGFKVQVQSKTEEFRERVKHQESKVGKSYRETVKRLRLCVG